MSLTENQRRDVAADVAASLVARGVDRRVAASLVQRATARTLASGMGGCGGGCSCCACCGSNGLGTSTTPTAPVAIAGAPGILADVSAAGDNPSVTAARDVVSKWSWLIPVGGLLLSAKEKVASAIGGRNDPSLSVARGARRR